MSAACMFHWLFLPVIIKNKNKIKDEECVTSALSMTTMIFSSYCDDASQTMRTLNWCRPGVSGWRIAIKMLLRTFFFRSTHSLQLFKYFAIFIYIMHSSHFQWQYLLFDKNERDKVIDRMRCEKKRESEWRYIRWGEC